MIVEQDFILASNNSWKLVDANHPLPLYVGKDANGLYAMEFRGLFTINKKMVSSEIIGITHFNNISTGEQSLVFSLLDNQWINQFIALCNDICNQTSGMQKNSKHGYEKVCDSYFFWKKMFKSKNDILSEEKIKGLMGELLFLKNRMIPQYGESKAIDAWSGTDKTKKDFSIDNTWYETKAIDYGKPSVGITSIEQLDSLSDGTLVVFQLEKMAPEFSGLNLNNLTNQIFGMLNSIQNKDAFAEKLNKGGYYSDPRYENFVYVQRDMSEYLVNGSFPRLKRSELPSAIAKASFELLLSEIQTFKK